MRKLFEKPFFLTIVLSFFCLSTARDTLTPNQPLLDNETLVSSGETFSLGFFSPGNSTKNRYIGVWYERIPGQTIVWVANRQNPITTPTAVLMLAVNGSLLITDGSSKVFWSSGSTSVVSNPIAQLLDTANFVVRDSSSTTNPNSFAWQSFDYPTDSLIPGMKLGWNLTSGLNRNLTAWSSPTNPFPSNYTLALDLRGDPQLYFWNGHVVQVRSGPWTGLVFSGELLVTLSFANTFNFIFVNNKEEVYYTVDVVNKSTLTRLVVNQSGKAERYVWHDESNLWDETWYTPRGQCDHFAVCGPNGVCAPVGSPMCSCLPGFKPKSQENWALRYTSDGCIRKTELDCKNGTDGFVTVTQTQLADTANATVDMRMSLDECRASCLKNCSCTGYANADMRGDGSGCIIWSGNLVDSAAYSDVGQKFYLRLAGADIDSISSQSRKSGNSTVAIALCVVLGAILLLASTVCYAWRKRKRTRGNTSINEENIAESTSEDDMELPLFDLVAIEAATDNFANENKVGEGGFGPVYKGKTSEGQEIAVKRLAKTSVQGLDELKTEVRLVAKLQHRNLVRLIGCCIQGDERILVYEYMPNKSLDAFLFDDKKVVLLDWTTRYQIILGIARGLLYLHEDSRFRIIHRDLKAGNILLDKDMNPKISDFGLARIFVGDEAKTMTKRVVGTYGYMSPEYALNGIISVKSDVFSFGVLVLEIISGKRNKGVYLSEAEEYLLGEAWTLGKAGNGVQLVDSSLASTYLASEVLRCMNVALLCVQERPEDRPTMSSVVLMLGSDQVFLPEPKQPGFVAKKRSPGENSSLMKENSHSINDLTLTMSIAR